MVMPNEIEEYAAYRRGLLLGEAATDRLVGRATPPIRLRRIGLAAVLRAIASRLDGEVRPTGGQPVIAAR
jgi:hypothetical protein